MAKGPSRKGTTLADVAAASGLSASAVSLALRGRGGVSEATRARIEEIADKLGYQQKASSAKRSRTWRTIGLLIRTIHDSTLRDNVFYGPIMAGIEENCRAHHMNLMLQVMAHDHFHPVEFPPIVTDKSCDGLIVMGLDLSEDESEILRTGHPAVLVDAYSESNAIDSVVIDNVRGAQTAVEHLVALGHREIAVLAAGLVRSRRT